jgi:hypothetical protein
LKSLGLVNVINECVDFYTAIEEETVPEYDVLITNPPFSGDHMERLLAFCVKKQSKPVCCVNNTVGETIDSRTGASFSFLRQSKTCVRDEIDVRDMMFSVQFHVHETVLQQTNIKHDM